MGKLVRGEVIVLPFPYSDLSASKRRPALVLASDPHYDDLILCMITSKNRSDLNAIEITSTDFETGDLPVQSNIRPNRLFTANSSIVLRTAGSLSKSKVDEVIDKIIDILTSE